MAKIGDSLIKPEEGWKRYESTDERFNLNGAFVIYTADGPYGASGGSAYSIPSSTSEADINNSCVEFKFKGTDIRFIGSRYDEYSKDMSMIVDGKEYEGSSYTSGSDLMRQVIICEALNLSNDLHLVTIKCNDSIRYDFDAIDINEEGSLHYIITEEDLISKGNSSLSYTLPMNHIDKINNKTLDPREGLLGMANNSNNYGELYVVGKDGQSHLTKGGATIRTLFEGSITEIGEYKLSDNINNYEFIVIHSSVNNEIVNIDSYYTRENKLNKIFSVSTDNRDYQLYINALLFDDIFELMHFEERGWDLNIHKIVGVY